MYKYTGLAIALILPMVLSFIKLPLADGSLTGAIWKELMFWALFALLYINIRFGERESFGALGFRPPTWKTSGLALLICVTVFLTTIFYQLIIVKVLHIKQAPELKTEMIHHYPAWLKLIITVRAGVIEETFYRAYAISRLRQITKRTWLAAIISVVVFAAAHYSYGSINHVLGALVIGIVLTIWYLRKRNLTANMVAHSLYDFILLMLR